MSGILASASTAKMSSTQARDDGQWLAIFSRDEQDRIVAGLHGWTWAEWLKINYLWVSPDARRRGRGRQMLLMAEAEARKRGCCQAMLYTYSFQAAFRRQTSITSSATGPSPRSKVFQKVIDT